MCMYTTAPHAGLTGNTCSDTTHERHRRAGEAFEATSFPVLFNLSSRLPIQARHMHRRKRYGSEGAEEGIVCMLRSRTKTEIEVRMLRQWMVGSSYSRVITHAGHHSAPANLPVAATCMQGVAGD